jgi:hypothetical protein
MDDTRFFITGFFMNQFHRAPEYPFGVVSNLTNICGDIRNFAFIATVV